MVKIIRTSGIIHQLRAIDHSRDEISEKTEGKISLRGGAGSGVPGRSEQGALWDGEYEGDPLTADCSEMERSFAEMLCAVFKIWVSFFIGKGVIQANFCAAERVHWQAKAAEYICAQTVFSGYQHTLKFSAKFFSVP